VVNHGESSLFVIIGVALLCWTQVLQLGTAGPSVSTLHDASCRLIYVCKIVRNICHYVHSTLLQVHFDNVKFIEPQRRTITLTNTGQVLTFPDSRNCKFYISMFALVFPTVRCFFLVFISSSVGLLRCYRSWVFSRGEFPLMGKFGMSSRKFCSGGKFKDDDNSVKIRTKRWLDSKCYIILITDNSRLRDFRLVFVTK